MLDPHLRRATRRSHAVSTNTQILVTLRFYASGTFQNVLAETVGLSQPTVSGIINNVTAILERTARTDIKMPKGPAAVTAAMQVFTIHFIETRLQNIQLAQQ